MSHTSNANYLGGPTPAARVVEQPANQNINADFAQPPAEFVDLTPTSPITAPQNSERPSLREAAADIANRAGWILSTVGLAGLGWLGLTSIWHAAKGEAFLGVKDVIKT